MNWIRIKLWFANIYGFAVAFPFVPIAIGLLLLIALVVGGIKSCNSARRERNIDNIKSNILIDKVEGNMLSNQVKELKEEVNQAVNRGQDVKKRLEDAKNANLNTKNSNYDDARRRFCEKYGC